MLRKLMIGAAAAALFASAASAADLPAYEPAPAVVAVPSFTWTGFYLGAQAGYSFGDTNLGRVKPEGFVVGGYAGYNVQLDNSPLVFGVETDFNYADVKDNSGGATVESNWNGATRGRVGYAFDRFLVYGAAGVAYANTEVRAAGLGRDKQKALGYTVGAGAEYAVTDNVALRADYRYSDYGKEKYNLDGVTPRASYDEHRVMGGVSYKFSGW